MQYVGSELERLALINTDPNSADLLGRSAFNRYYYAAFLITRETLGYMQPKEGANKQVISSQADSLIKISRIWADFFPANTSNQPI